MNSINFVILFLTLGAFEAFTFLQNHPRAGSCLIFDDTPIKYSKIYPNVSVECPCSCDNVSLYHDRTIWKKLTHNQLLGQDRWKIVSYPYNQPRDSTSSFKLTENFPLCYEDTLEKGMWKVLVTKIADFKWGGDSLNLTNESRNLGQSSSTVRPYTGYTANKPLQYSSNIHLPTTPTKISFSYVPFNQNSNSSQESKRKRAPIFEKENERNENNIRTQERSFIRNQVRPIIGKENSNTPLNNSYIFSPYRSEIMNPRNFENNKIHEGGANGGIINSQLLHQNLSSNFFKDKNLENRSTPIDLTERSENLYDLNNRRNQKNWESRELYNRQETVNHPENQEFLSHSVLIPEEEEISNKYI